MLSVQHGPGWAVPLLRGPEQDRVVGQQERPPCQHHPHTGALQLPGRAILAANWTANLCGLFISNTLASLEVPIGF